MIIDSIRDYLIKCPYLEQYNDAIVLNVNYLDDNADTYSIEEIPSEPIIKKYVNGDTKRQYQFTFCSREPYSAEILQNIENSGFYEKFAKWLENESLNGNLPILESGLIAQDIQAISNGYAYKVDEDKALYQIECKLIYLKLGGR